MTTATRKTITDTFAGTSADRADHTADAAGAGPFKSVVAYAIRREDSTAAKSYAVWRDWRFTFDVTWTEWRAMKDAGISSRVAAGLAETFAPANGVKWTVNLVRMGGEVMVDVCRIVRFADRAGLPKTPAAHARAVDFPELTDAARAAGLVIDRAHNVALVLASVVAGAVTKCREAIEAERDAEQVKHLRKQIAMGLRDNTAKVIDYERRLQELKAELRAAQVAREVEYRAEVLRAYLGDGAPDGKPTAEIGEMKPANLRAACAEPVEIKDFGPLFGS